MHKSSPQVLCTKSFLQNQGYNINKATLYQDNNSAVLIGGNDRASRSSCTKHVNIRYFIIKEHIDKGKVIIEHCHIKYMVVDYFTKPLQGRKFRYFRSRIMGLPPSMLYLMFTPLML